MAKTTYRRGFTKPKASNDSAYGELRSRYLQLKDDYEAAAALSSAGVRVAAILTHIAALVVTLDGKPLQVALTIFRDKLQDAYLELHATAQRYNREIEPNLSKSVGQQLAAVDLAISNLDGLAQDAIRQLREWAIANHKYLAEVAEVLEKDRQSKQELTDRTTV